MKRKLLLALLWCTILAGGASYQVYHAMQEVTFKIGNIIYIYKIQAIREKLGFQLRKIQEELILKDTPYNTIDPNTLIDDVSEMNQTMISCFGCHHEEQTSAMLHMLQDEIEDFKSDLSRVFTIRANRARYLEAAGKAYNQGSRLLEKVDGMLSSANTKLEKRSNLAMAEVMTIMKLVTILMFALPVLLLLAGSFILKSITKPIDILMKATAELSQGAMDHRVVGLKDEFGRLGDSFNLMAESLANQRQVSQRAEQMTVVGQMAAGLAHEIKNPLAGIKVSMEVLKGESYIHDQDRQVMGMVIAVINRVNSLINDLLNFARPSSPSLQSIPINSLLEQTTTSAMYTLAKPHATQASDLPSFICKTALAPDLPNVKADPGQVQQIILNLIINAFDAMPQGGTVIVSSKMAQRPGFVAATITDTGPGIGAEIRDKIFVPFFSTKRKGTGLGLAICKTIAESNGGSIMANDTIEGQGASFSVLLPLADQQGTM